jgi:hypothetical protein
MSNIKRICLYAGPGSGKSVCSAFLYQHLSKNKNLNKKIELVREYAKEWAYENRKIKDWKQLYAFSKQLNREYIPLSNGADVVVTDCPLFLSYIYAEKYNVPAKKEILKIAFEFENEYPGLHIFIDRSNNEYINQGRFENKNEALLIDNDILSFFNNQNIKLNQVVYNDEISLLKAVYPEIRKNANEA